MGNSQARKGTKFPELFEKNTRIVNFAYYIFFTPKHLLTMSDNNRTAAMSGLLAGNETLAKVSDVEYSKVQSYFEMLEAVSRLTYQSIYVMDYCKMNFLYVSDNPIFLCGRTREEVMAMGFDFLLEQCKPEEVHALIEINRASLDFFHHLPVSERDRYSVPQAYSRRPFGRRRAVARPLFRVLGSG